MKITSLVSLYHVTYLYILCIQYIYIIFNYSFNYSLSQDIEYSSLCYTVGHCLSIAHFPNLVDSHSDFSTLKIPLERLICDHLF